MHLERIGGIQRWAKAQRVSQAKLTSSGQRQDALFVTDGQKQSTLFLMTKRKRQSERAGKGGSSFLSCPCCNKTVPAALINIHLDTECAPSAAKAGFSEPSASPSRADALAHPAGSSSRYASICHLHWWKSHVISSITPEYHRAISLLLARRWLSPTSSCRLVEARPSAAPTFGLHPQQVFASLL